MKAGIYQSLYTLNESLQLVVAHLEKLQAAEILRPGFAEIRRLAAEQMRAEINVAATSVLQTRELHDAHRFFQQRLKQEQKLEPT